MSRPGTIKDLVRVLKMEYDISIKLRIKNEELLGKITLLLATNILSLMTISNLVG
jgi:hypothetical protein